MKNVWAILSMASIATLAMVLVLNSRSDSQADDTVVMTAEHDLSNSKGCTFRTIFGEESSDSNFIYKSPENVAKSIESGLEWMMKAQHENGGWGAGSHTMQHVRDPHAVNPDPATTSMVAMALLRTGNTPTKGEYSKQLLKATDFLLATVEEFEGNSSTITSETGTQIQSKLGQYIDVVLTTQFLTNILDYDLDAAREQRVRRCLDICVTKIQGIQDADGSTRGSGWAGVLQSSFANNALEAANAKGATVDTVLLAKSRDYQKSNYNSETGDVDASKGAGVVLYSVSSSKRASAVEAKKAREIVEKAKDDGIVDDDVEVSPEVLQHIGISEDQALSYSTSYNVYESAKRVAQQEDVMRGFGNNGGEEFLSYLQTGESMVINHDNDWKKWYDDMSGRLIKIQNADGSWNGHHCITSPVFCTATCLLVLSINNDTENLMSISDK